jgi:hypothetical protein
VKAAALAMVLLVVLKGAPAFALGQLPLVSEDPSSPCASTLETSIGYSMDLVGPGHDQLGQQEFRSHVDMSAPLVQFNYGITDRIQARISGEIPVTTVAPNNGGPAAGFGDVSTGLKYRFMDQIDGLEYEDTCDPPQNEDPDGIQGPVSISIFPQFSFPTGSASHGLGSGEYSLEFPFDVAREIGNLYLVGEGNFIWNYHDRQSPNQLEVGIAIYYSLTSKWELLGEQRLSFATSGRGATLWFMNIGSDYELNRYLTIFGAVGTSVAATSTVAPSNLTTIVGATIKLPIDW